MQRKILHYVTAIGVLLMAAGTSSAYYDATGGRFLSPDPLGHEACMDLYSYANGDPVKFVDPLGLKPGDIYPSRDLAAINAIRDINPLSISSNYEFGGFIYRYRDGTYSYTPPVTQFDHLGVKLEPANVYVPWGTWIASTYHTHGAGDDIGDNPIGPYDFSLADKSIADNDGALRPIYIGLPDGIIRIYQPVPGKDNLFKGDDRVISHQDPSTLPEWKGLTKNKK